MKNPTPKCFFLFFFFFFFFFLYHEFIVFRYKKLRAALAMEKTKPINQKLKHKKPTIKILRYPEVLGKTITSALQISKYIGKLSKPTNWAPAARKNIKQSKAPKLTIEKLKIQL